MPCPVNYQYTADRRNASNCRISDILDVEHYDKIRHSMLDQEGHQANQRLGLIHLSGDNLHDELLAAKVGVQSPAYYTDTSFSQQMHSANSASSPDVILATYRSAVPVLAAVQGYYEGSNRRVPVLSHVEASFMKRVEWHGHEALRQAEIERLSELVCNKSVLVIDQTFGNGGTLKRAGKIATAAGAASVIGMVGYWYGNLMDERHEETPFPPAESLWHGEHEAFMYKVGRAAAEVAIDRKDTAPTLEEVIGIYRGSIYD
jgi:phosphoribosylpyrophosphate synthetase